MADTSYDIVREDRWEWKQSVFVIEMPVTLVKIAYTMGFTENLVKTLNI